jgi:hypothetical protein
MNPIEFTLRPVQGHPDMQHLAVTQNGKLLASGYRRWDHPQPVADLVKEAQEQFPNEEVVLHDLTSN